MQRREVVMSHNASRQTPSPLRLEAKDTPQSKGESTNKQRESNVSKAGASMLNLSVKTSAILKPIRKSEIKELAASL